MADIKYYGLESHFNENVTFNKDVNINGNLNYDSLTVRNLTVREQSNLGITTTTSLSAQNLSVSGITTVGFITAQNISVSGIVTATKFVGIVSTSAGEKQSQVTFNAGSNTAIITGITWSSSYDATTQTLGSIVGASATNVKALNVSLYYMHNGATDHGYLTGWVFQTGKNYGVDGVYTANAHFNWYFNIIEIPLIIPWDPSGTQSLSMYVSSAYNTNTNNQYSFYQKGIITQT